MAAGSRHENFLMRQRGAGFQREIKEDDFGFSFGAIGGDTASAGTAAQRAKKTSRSSASVTPTASQRGASLRSNAQSETTIVDENGSVVKKRRLAPNGLGSGTPLQELANGNGEGSSLSQSRTASTGKKRRKRKSISQSSLNKKRASNASQRSTSGARTSDIQGAEEVPTPVDDGGVELQDDAAEVSVEANPGPSVQEADSTARNAGVNAEPESINPIDPEPSTSVTAEISWKRKPKARKSTGGPPRGFQSRASISKLADSTATEINEAEFHKIQTTEDEPGPTVEAGFTETSGETLEQAISPIARPQAKPKRKGRRKSVNPIQNERRKKRASLEAARQPIGMPELSQRSAKPTGRKLAIQRSQPHPAVKAKADATQISKLRQNAIPIETIEKLKELRAGTSVPRDRPSTYSRSGQGSKKGKPGSIEITVFRLQNAPRLSPVPEGDEETTQDIVSKATRRKGPNAIDALAQVCGEIVRSKIAAAAEAEDEASERSSRALAKLQRLAIETFGQQLETRFIGMAQAIDHYGTLLLRLREAKTARKSLRSELLESRRAVDESDHEAYRLRKRRDLVSEMVKDDVQLIALYKNLGRAIRDARNEQQEDDDLTPQGLEYDLKKAESYSSSQVAPT